jgi:hypothetical protein
MSKCDAADRFREIVFEQGSTQITAWARDHIRLAQWVKIQGEDGDWLVRALTTNTLCEKEMLAKAKDRPKLYPIVEVR